MSLTEFSMVKELASLVKDNIPSKHLVLAVEDALVNFLHDDTSSHAVLELEPMDPYNRLLVHRLADIFGFCHQSVGEGEDRHLVLECCSDTSMPGILVSDFLLRSGELKSPITYEVLRRKEEMPGQSIDGMDRYSLEERRATYFAAREKIQSADICDSNLIKQRPRKDSTVARRMITHALGQPNKVIKHDLGSIDGNEFVQTVKGVKILCVDDSDVRSSDNLETESLYVKHSIPCTVSKTNRSSDLKFSSKEPQKKNDSRLIEGGSTSEGSSYENSLKKEHMGAAKRLFANALGVNLRDINPSKFCESKKTNC